MIAPLQLLFALAVCVAADPVHAAKLLPLAVTDGRCDFVMPAGGVEDRYLLVVGSTALGKGPFRVTVRAERTDRPASLPLAGINPTADFRNRVNDTADRLARIRKERKDEPEAASADPPRRRTFYLFVKEDEFFKPDSYEEVAADLRAVGKHCQVYVDREHTDRDALQPTIDDAVKTFDESVFPLARKALGRCLDVDRDGRFTILFSPKLSRMSAGKVRLEGFVRGADFFRDRAAPFGNRCDLMYLNTDLKPGNYLRGIIAHEYTHAVVFSEHVLGDYLPAKERVDEESWLNEGLAHLAEDLHGFGWANLDHRVAAFLGRPEQYPLVVADYYADRVWRSAGHRGAAYLFVRWCADAYGEDVAGRFVQSSLRGVANLEAATREPFANLFREWTAALAVSGTGIEVEGVRPLRRIDLRGKLGEEQLTGPHFRDLAADGSAEVELAATSAAYFRVPAGVRVAIETAPDAGLQVTLITASVSDASQKRCGPDASAKRR
jgi:hypothetical protein